MAKFKVIRAHDGIAEGTIKELPASAVTAYMVKNGWWEALPDEAPAGQPAAKKATSSKKKK